MRFFDINLVTVMVRFYLMMAVVIIGIFSGQVWLAGLALPIFLSVMLGITFRKEDNSKKANIKKSINKVEKKTAA